MSNTNKHRLINKDIKQDKDNVFLKQFKTFECYLNKNIATASMVAKATGIPQKNICRFKRTLEKRGQLIELNKKTCIVTGFKAWYLTTNPEAFPKSKQLSLF